MNFLALLERGDLNEEARQRFNALVNRNFEGIRDYICTHYKTNSRTDTEYWRANAANMDLSDNLKKILSLWVTGKSIVPGLRAQEFGQGYPVMSWFAILAGMGIFPQPQALRPPSAQEARYELSEVDALLQRCAGNYLDHRVALERIPPARAPLTLQLYFW